jgi:hypothetical protein
MRRSLILVAVFGVLATSLLGQTYRGFRGEWDEVIGKARIILGPLRVFPLLSFRNVGYDDNVNFDVTAKGDYTGTISPEVKVFWPVGGTVLLSASENPEYNYYARESSRRSFSNSYSFGVKTLLLSRFVLLGNTTQAVHRRRLSSELGTLVTDESRGFDAGLYFETARRTSLGVTVFQNDVDYENIQLEDNSLPLSRVLNRKERGGKAEFYYQAFYEGFFYLVGECTEFEFKNPESAWRNASAIQGTIGLRFPVGAAIRGNLALGYKRFRPNLEGLPSYSGLIGKTDLNARFGRIGLRTRYGRDNVFSYFSDILFFVEDTVGGGISFYLTDFLRLDYDYDRGKSDYPEFFIFDPATGGRLDVIRKDRHETHSAGIVVRLFGTTGMGLTWNSARWTSSLPGWDRRRRFIGAFLTYQF